MLGELKKFIDSLKIQEHLAPLFSKPAPTRLIPEPNAEGFVKSFDGTDIFWELHGPDPKTCDERPMVFCYGLICSMSQWRLQLERYSQIRPCLLFDYRGHHKSSYPADPKLMNIPALARDLAAVIENQKFLEAPHIWGHSLGAGVALELALSQPELCRSLVLCCGTVTNPFLTMFNTNLVDKVFQKIKEGYPKNPALYEGIWAASMIKTDLAHFLARNLGFNASASTQEDIKTYVEAVAAVEARTFFPLVIDLSRGIPAPMLKKIHTPVFVVAGAKDHITVLATQQKMAEALPNATLIEIPAGSHNVQLDFGEYVCMKIEQLWREKNLW